jgi:hypothetical protein
MSLARFQSLSFLLLAFSLFSTRTQAANVAPPQTFDQVVRLSLVEGDVRVLRGKGAEHATDGSDWGQAAANLPLLTGFSLATGKGRAEIELEDASTVYLGENSVLTLNELTATGGVPLTDMTLVSGTATINVKPATPGETFTMRSPTEKVWLRYPQKAYLRIDSYLDAMSVTPQSGVEVFVGEEKLQQSPGQTVTFGHGLRFTSKAATSAALAEWDDWTAKRIEARNDAMTATMKEAGLSAPIPGLAEMKDQGTFFACAPYGTCWEPKNGWAPDEASAGQTAQSDPHTVSVKELQEQQRSGKLAAQMTAQNSPAAGILRTQDDYFPCSPNLVRRLIARDPVTGQSTVLRSWIYPNATPYDWAICHAGTWIQRNRHYVWVAGTKRHHHCPVRWVKTGGTKGFVPLHPHDVAGKPPINAKHGIFEPTGKKGEAVQLVAYNSSAHMKVLEAAPKEFSKDYYPPLQRAETPHLEAHLVKDGLGSSRDVSLKVAGTPIRFDHRSESLVVARQVMQGSKTTTVTDHFGGHSEVAAIRSGEGFSGGSSFHSGGGGFSGSGSSHSSASGGSGGGSFHGGGSSGAGGGGASHGGGGGGGGGSSGGGSHK